VLSPVLHVLNTKPHIVEPPLQQEQVSNLASLLILVANLGIQLETQESLPGELEIVGVVSTVCVVIFLLNEVRPGEELVPSSEK